MSAHVFDSMLARFMSVYGHPDSENVEGFLAEYARILKGYTASELAAAADEILKKHRFKTWPSIAECVNACENGRARAAQSKPKSYATADDTYVSRQGFADATLRSHRQTAERAAMEGWLLGLHEFVMKQGRMPNVREASEIRETSDFVTRCATGQQDMGALHHPLRALANSIVERRETTYQRLFGEAAE